MKRDAAFASIHLINNLKTADANERAYSLRKSLKAELIGDNRGYEIKKRKRELLERLMFKKEEIKTGNNKKSREETNGVSQ